MSAMEHIKAYLGVHFANHDIETLMTHFETAIEAKVEEGLAELRQELTELRNDLIRPVTEAKPVPSLATVDQANMTATEAMAVAGQPAADQTTNETGSAV